MLDNLSVNNKFIFLKEGFSRINVKLKNIDGTEINANGPDITKDKVDLLMQQLSQLKDGDTLVLAGSIPSSMDSSIYENILSKLQDKKINVVVDATKELLTNVLKYKPFLIKPNNHELEEIFKTKISGIDDIVYYGKKLREMGAENVLVSMAGDGAVLIAADGNVYHSAVPKGKLVNAVGSGDSMVAGFIYGWQEKQSYEYAFKMGICSGSASAFSEYLATKEEIFNLYNQITSEGKK